MIEVDAAEVRSDKEQAIGALGFEALFVTGRNLSIGEGELAEQLPLLTESHHGPNVRHRGLTIESQRERCFHRRAVSDFDGGAAGGGEGMLERQVARKRRELDAPSGLCESALKLGDELEPFCAEKTSGRKTVEESRVRFAVASEAWAQDVEDVWLRVPAEGPGGRAGRGEAEREKTRIPRGRVRTLS